MKTSIKTAIMVPLLAALILGITVMAIIVGILSSNTASRLTDSNIETSVSLYTKEFSALCQDAYGTVTSIAPLVADSLNNDNTREITDPRGYAVNLLSEVLMANSNVFAIWTAWEPNAFDREDSRYVGTSFYDDTGRFVPYISRSGNGISVSALTDYDDSVAGAYYQGARSSGKPYMTDPYFYDVNR
jgi:hypothetical protein